MKTLRKYQIEDHAAIEAALKQYQSVLYQLPTGGGKSVIATNVISRRKDKNVLVFVHKRRLMTQLEDHFKSLNGKVGILGGGREENLDANIVIVSIRTAAKDNRLEKLLERSWDFTFIDEARNSRTKTYDKVIAALKEHNPMIQLFGVDATPYRKDKKRLDLHFNHLVVSKENTASLMEKGFLQQCRTIVCPFSIDQLQEEVHEVANDYQMSELSKFMRKSQYLEFLVAQYLAYGEERSAIIYAVDKAHAQSIVEIFEDNGYEGLIAKVDSSMSSGEIDSAFAKFESKEIQLLVNVEMVTEGVDIPIAGCIIGARPTKSLTLFLQMGGRILRPDGEFDYCIMLDCCGWTQEYGSIKAPREWSLNPEIDPSAARIGYKVFGKKQDGKLVEDIEDFDGEIIELSPEEYFEQLSNGQEQAEKHNKSIEEKIDDVCESIITVLFGGKEDWKKKYQIHSCDEYNGELSIRLKIFDKRQKNEDGDYPVFKYRSTTVNIFHRNGNRDRKPFIKIDTSSFDKDQDMIEHCYGEAIDTAVIYQNVLHKSKVLEDVVGLALTIKQLDQKMIDTREFEKRRKQMEQDQFIEDIRNHIKDNDHIFAYDPDAHRPIHVDNYFKDNGTWRGGYYNRIVGIHVKSSLKGHNNAIILHTQSRWKEGDQSIETFERSYLKEEKVIELITDLGWKKQN